MKRQHSPTKYGKSVKKPDETPDQALDYVIIYSGIKSFFRPFEKVNIDMVLHLNIKPSPCLEVIGYHQEVGLESRLYLVFDDLNEKLNKHELDMKKAQLILDAEKQGKVIAQSAVDEAVLYSQISNYVLAHLTSHAVIDPDNENEDEEESFTLGYTALPTDKPMRLLEGDFDPSFANDVEWGLSCRTNILTVVESESAPKGKPKAPVKEYVCVPLDVEVVNINRPLGSDSEDEELVQMIGVTTTSTQYISEEAQQQQDSSPTAADNDTSHHLRHVNTTSPFQQTGGGAYIKKPSVPNFMRNSNSIATNTANNVIGGSPASMSSLSRTATRKSLLTLNADVDIGITSNQLSQDARQLRHVELEALRFNASDNTFIPGGIRR